MKLWVRVCRKCDALLGITEITQSAGGLGLGPNKIYLHCEK